ncbi:hypothetical protein ACTA71_008399 [Dictyostelium dimigraforme]
MEKVEKKYVMIGKKRKCKPFKMAYKIFGCGSNKVLFVMGFMLEGKFWSGIPAKYMDEPDKYTICVFDQCGTGDSDYSYFSNLKHLAMDIIELLNHLKWEKTNIVAVSIGAAVSWELARIEPDLIKSLNILSIPSIGFGLNTYRQFLMLPIYSRLHNIESCEMYSRLIISDSFFNSPSKFKDGLNKEYVMPLAKSVHNSRFDYKYMSRFSHWISAAFHKVKPINLEPFERKFPIVMFFGTDDPLAPELKRNEYIYQIIKPNLVYICNGGGHCLQTEDNETFNQLSMKFIDYSNDYKPDSIETNKINQFYNVQFLEYNVGYRIPSSNNPFPLKNSIIFKKNFHVNPTLIFGVIPSWPTILDLI